MARKRPAKKSVGAKAVKSAAKSRAAKKAARSASKSPVAAKKTKAKADKKAMAPPAKTARAAKARRTVAEKAAKRTGPAKTSATKLAKTAVKPAAKSARKSSTHKSLPSTPPPRKPAEAAQPLPTARRSAPRISAGRRADSRKVAGREALAKNTLAVRTAPARKPTKKSPAKKRPAKRAPAPKAAGKTARSRLTPRATQTLAPPVLRDTARRRVVKPTAPRPEKPAARVRRAPFRLHALGVRDEHPTDRAQISALLSAAFERPDESANVERARTNGNIVLSLVAEYDSEIVGHIAFVRVEALIDGKAVKAVELTPLAVAPSRQGRGIGSVLVGAGLEAARTAGFDAVFVAGDSAYFTRFGFSSQIAKLFESDELARLSAIELKAGALTGGTGTLARPPS
ncbi:MAG: N-acetyltransferase [Beijerinckiaceae bacterium]|nr:N-acetyltransferase [Beijerinckiaceae bacterium]